MTAPTQTAPWRKMLTLPADGGGWTAPLYAALAQILAAVWSYGLRSRGDDPFSGKGTLTRVVSNVTSHVTVPR